MEIVMMEGFWYCTSVTTSYQYNKKFTKMSLRILSNSNAIIKNLSFPEDPNR